MTDNGSCDPATLQAPRCAEQPTIFPLGPPSAPPARPVPADPKQGTRLRHAQRAQIAWGRIDLEAMLPEDHAARAIWAVVDRLDLSRLYAQIAARDDVAGAPAIDPKILLALWVYASGEGALMQVPAVTATKQRSGAKDTTVRVSSTDPDARVMKMSDGGCRPAFNVQFPTTTDTARVIVGVALTNRGSDQGETTPLLEQIEQRAATAETINADAKEHRGLDSLTVRGREKALGSALLFALTYNILRLPASGATHRGPSGRSISAHALRGPDRLRYT